jgi:ubiquinone/menaquinone biosynthesis C-methylase UbiE/DNA-binding transcriptional ArsR family regulator
MPLSVDSLINALKAAGERTRLRVLALLARAELTVKDLTAILAQSQPRISRHLKLLTEAGLVDRYPEGAWVFYRLSDDGPAGRLARQLCRLADAGDAVLSRDRERLAQVKRDQAEQAEHYFSANAADWDTIRALHVAENDVEAAMLEVVGAKPFQTLLDLGTGTGRMLELFAPLCNRAIGVDASTAMLAVARANLDRAGVGHAQVRLGDIYNLPLPRDAFDLVTIHQVLHYLDEPERAIAEAARVLAPDGRLLIVDFAPHALEFLRERHAHRRLGFGHEPMAQWVGAADLDLERVLDLPAGEGAADKLTVTLWLARDRRVAVAGGDAARQVA